MIHQRTLSSKVRIDPTSTHSNKRAYLILVLVLAVVVMLHAQNLDDGFLIDDPTLIKAAHIFFPGQMDRLLGPDMSTYWRPVFKLFILPAAYVFGYHPAGYHFLSLCLHLACIGLLYAVARRFIPSAWAAGAAALFGLHPVHVGTVAWIAAGYDLLATTFVLACCLFYLRSLVSLGRADRIAALIFMTLAFFTKEVAFITPFLIVIFAAFFGPSSIWANLVGRIKGVLLFFLVAAALIGVRIVVMGAIGGPGGHTGHPEILHPQWSIVFANYIQGFPTAFHSPVNRASLGAESLAFSIVNPVLTGLGWLILGGLVLYRKRRETWVGFGFSLTACAPFSFFAYIGPNLESGYMLYLASAGFAIFVATVAHLAAQGESKFGKVFLAGLALWGLMLPPLAWMHASAFSTAGRIADIMREGIARSMDQVGPIGPVYCENFPGEFHGVRLFYDELDQLLWPVMEPTAPGTVLLVNETMLLRHPGLPPFREAATGPGFRHLLWEAGQVADHTAKTVSSLQSIEQSDTVEQMFLKVPDKKPRTWHMTLPTLEIKAPEVIPASSITRLCLEMNLSTPESTPGEKPTYRLTWTMEEGAYTATLPYAPSADGFTCALLDRDPRFALGDVLSEFFVTPVSESGRIKIARAEIIYRTKKIEIFEELVLKPDDPLLQMLTQ